MTELVIPNRITHALGRVPANTGSGFLFGHPCLISPQPMSLEDSKMAGYVKIWTTLKDNKEFLSLSMSQRGMYTQLLLDIKKGRDNGTVGYRDWTGLGSSMGCDGRTASKTLTILQQKCLCTYHKDGDGVILVTIPNYKKWQDLTVKEVLGKLQKPSKIAAKMQPLRPDQTRLKQTRPDHLLSETSSDHKKAVEYWCSKYLDKFQVKYNFQAGKDGKLVKQLLSTYGFVFFCRLVDQIYVTNDEFIINKGKVTIGVLSACANKLAQEIVNRSDVRSLFTEKERQSIINIAKGLGLDHEVLELKHEP